MDVVVVGVFVVAGGFFCYWLVFLADLQNKYEIMASSYLENDIDIS